VLDRPAEPLRGSADVRDRDRGHGKVYWLSSRHYMIFGEA
jgi:hypothetical protein